MTNHTLCCTVKLICLNLKYECSLKNTIFSFLLSISVSHTLCFPRTHIRSVKQYLYYEKQLCCRVKKDVLLINENAALTVVKLHFLLNIVTRNRKIEKHMCRVYTRTHTHFQKQKTNIWAVLSLSNGKDVRLYDILRNNLNPWNHIIKKDYFS